MADILLIGRPKYQTILFKGPPLDWVLLLLSKQEFVYVTECSLVGNEILSSACFTLFRGLINHNNVWYSTPCFDKPVTYQSSSAYIGFTCSIGGLRNALSYQYYFHMRTDYIKYKLSIIRYTQFNLQLVTFTLILIKSTVNICCQNYFTLSRVYSY